MYQREAMWIKFNGQPHNPKALKVAIGKVNAISGKTWDQSLKKDVEDYCVIPDQPWLDGINAGNGHIKQFVAMPLGSGYTVEGQVTGKEEFGGIQLIVYENKNTSRGIKPTPKPIPLKPILKPPPPFFAPYIPPPDYTAPIVPQCATTTTAQLQCLSSDYMKFSAPVPRRSKKKMMSSEMTQSDGAQEMGLSAGGKMKQKIYKDKYGIDYWDQNNFGRVYVHIVNSAMYKKITGKEPPPTPVSAKIYTEYGYPWYDLYDEHKQGVQKSDILSNVKSVSEIDKEKYAWPQQDDSTVSIKQGQVKQIYKSDEVRDGDW
jgi:hypothetical protein